MDHNINIVKSKKCCNRKKIIVFIFFPLGIVLLFFGMFCQSLFNAILKDKLVLKKGGQTFKTWQMPPIPVYVKFHIYNYTNVQDIITKRAKPHVQEVGPFTYQEIRYNQILDYNENNITYIQNYTYQFVPSMSCATCNDNTTVWVPNISFLSVLRDIHDKVKNPNWFTSMSIQAFLGGLKGTTLFHKIAVKKLIWGYEDDILSVMSNLQGLLSTFGVKLPSSSMIQLQRNGTAYANDLGNLTVLTGKQNVNDVQRVVAWRGRPTAPYWNTPWANMINGSEGAQAPPFVSRSDRLYAFAPQLCRSFYFKYDKDVTFHGIPMFRFRPGTAKNKDNVTVSPNSPEFCNDTEVCLDGILPVGPCQFGNPPIFMSSPHFYLADPKLQGRILGLNPDPVKHSSFIDVEPTIGVTMRGYKRMQVNIMARKSFVKISQVFEHDVNFLPLCYVEQIGEIDEPTGSMFRNMVLMPKDIMKYGGITFIVVGAALILLTSYILVTGYYGKRKKNGDKCCEKSVENDNEPLKKDLMAGADIPDATEMSKLRRD